MRIENYSVVELLHLSFVIRDTLEYCHEKLPANEEIFEQRYKMISQLLDEKNFVARFLLNNPNEQGKMFYESLNKFFNNIYVNGNYVSLDTKKVDPDKKLEMLEEIIKNYQTVDDVLKSFLTSFKEQNVLKPEVENCYVATDAYFRTLYLFILYNAILKEDHDYKVAIRESKNRDAYECKYILNTLKTLVSIYNFNRQKYSGSDENITSLFNEIFTIFQKLDGTIKVENAEEMSKSIQQANALITQSLRKYELGWKESYQQLLQLLKENPVEKAEMPNKPQA